MAGRNYKPKIDVADVVVSYLVHVSGHQQMLADPVPADVAHLSRSSDMWASVYSFSVSYITTMVYMFGVVWHQIQQVTVHGLAGSKLIKSCRT